MTRPAITLSAMRTRCRRLQRTKGLSLVVIDYLQLMRPAAGTKPENRVLEISQITQGLKAIAKELKVPVLALSQLSRAVESREDKRPQLSDLRESGTIEQDADSVMFVYRDEYYLQQRAPKEMAFDNSDKFHTAVDKWQQDMENVHNRAELIIAKQRHGPTGDGGRCSSRRSLRGLRTSICIMMNMEIRQGKGSGSFLKKRTKKLLFLRVAALRGCCLLIDLP